MPAEVYIKGEQRTPLQYLVEPVTQVLRRAGEGALMGIARTAVCGMRPALLIPAQGGWRNWKRLSVANPARSALHSQTLGELEMNWQ